MVDNNNQNQTNVASQPPVRRLKKIKRLVKRPLPRPLPAQNAQTIQKSDVVTPENKQEILSSENLQRRSTQPVNLRLDSQKNLSDSAQISFDEQKTFIPVSPEPERNSSSENIDVLPDFSIDEPLFTDENVIVDTRKNLNLSSQNENSKVLPDSPNFLEDDTDLSLPVIKNSDSNSNDFNSPRFIQEQDIVSNNERISFVQHLKECDIFTKKVIALFTVAALVLGLFMGKLMFGTSTVVRNGLSGVVANPEVPKGRARCGVAEKTQGCVLYLMNPQRQDLNARDFYDLASQLTGRQRFVIETGNMRYSNVKIAPGEIAQFNIPPLQ